MNKLLILALVLLPLLGHGPLFAKVAKEKSSQELFSGRILVFYMQGD
jgi:hypothetical protein